jgi:hypothetical protein
MALILVNRFFSLTTPRPAARAEALLDVNCRRGRTPIGSAAMLSIMRFRERSTRRVSRGVPPRSFSSFGYDGFDGADERERFARFQQFSATLPRDRDFSVPAVLPSAVSARAAARRSRSVPLMLPMKPALPSVIFASLSSVQPASGLEKFSDRIRV